MVPMARTAGKHSHKIDCCSSPPAVCTCPAPTLLLIPKLTRLHMPPGMEMTVPTSAATPAATVARPALQSVC